MFKRFTTRDLDGEFTLAFGIVADAAATSPATFPPAFITAPRTRLAGQDWTKTTRPPVAREAVRLARMVHRPVRQGALHAGGQSSRTSGEIHGCRACGGSIVRRSGRYDDQTGTFLHRRRSCLRDGDLGNDAGRSGYDGPCRATHASRREPSMTARRYAGPGNQFLK